MLCFISCDLRSPHHDYQRFYSELARLGAKEVHDSLWVVRTNTLDADALLSCIEGLIGANDAAVTACSEHGEWASFNAQIDIRTV